MSCRRYESSVDKLEYLGRLVGLAPNPTGCVVGAPRVIVYRFETIEWMDTIGERLVLDSGAANWGSPPFKETI